jgi:Flp pilus assembly protein TadB
MRERKGADRKDLGIAGGFMLAIVSALVWRHSLLEIVPFLVGATLGFWLIVRARKRSSDRRQ